MTAFEEMGVLPEIAQAVEEMEWTLPTDVQAEAVPLILGGGDVLMAAETGSGKTGAFCLPILQIVWETLKDQEVGRGKKGGGAKASPSSKKWAMSFFDRGSALAVSPDGLTTQSRDQSGWHGCRCTKGVQYRGKYYYEAKVTDEGLCRVGWATQAASHDLGTDKQSFGYGGTGKKSFGRQFDDYGEKFGMHDVIGCYLDLDNGSVKFSKNGNVFGEAFRIPANLTRCPMFPAVVLKNAEMQFNFGDGETPFKHPPGDGYVAVSKAESECIVDSTVTGASVGAPGSVKNAPQAIIIEPSRELAEQTLRCITSFKKYLKDPVIRELLIIGGVSVKDQIEVLRNGVDIVVGTPGRLEDLIATGELSLTQVRFFVLDEADGLLNQGNGDLINRIHKQIPQFTADGRRLQMMVCSATLHSFEVKKLAERLMHFPTWVDLKGEDSVPETVHHVVCIVDPRKDTSWMNVSRHVVTDGVHERDNVRPGASTPETLSEAVKILKGEYTVRAIQQQKMDQGIIFCRTKLDCDNLENYLNHLGSRGRDNPFSCVCLHSDRKAQERQANLEKFKKGAVKFLICTDVAARGIDVSGVPFVINVTLPDEKSNYVHRIGRVGRAERMGLAISLVAAIPEKVWYHSNCKNRGRNCYNTNLTDRGGCCIWYNEPQYLSDIEDHLNVTIQQVEPDLKIPADEFDGKVVYGQKRKEMGSSYATHTAQMAPAVQELAALEKKSQSIFIQRYYLKDQSFLR
uniref:ATP-dependent RNA helicase n=1 Tax=Amblyomma triste TaxID=251400 RepID=A0A023GNS0_AMBTT